MKETKEFILKESQDLFLQKGFKAVTMKELVEKTGLTKGAFYHYFESKELLFREIVERNISSTLKINLNVSNVSLFQFYHDYADYFAASLFPQESKEKIVSFNYFFLIMDAINMFPDLLNKIVDSYHYQKECWEKVIYRAKITGEIKTQMKDEHIANMFLHSSDGLSMNIMLFKIVDVKKALLEVWDDFYNSLKG